MNDLARKQSEFNAQEFYEPPTPEQRMAVSNRILYCAVGSHLYGTNTKDSDLDYAGIFIPDPDYVIGLKRCDQVEFKTNPSSSGQRNSKDDKDETIYSLPKYLHLASQCNPNILEILYSPVPNLNLPHWFIPFGKELVANRDRFLSQKVRKTFLGYAYSQKEKLLVKKARLGAIRKAREDLHDIRTMKGIHGDDAIVNRLTVSSSTGEVYRIFESRTSLDYVVKELEEMEGEYGLRTKSIEQYGFDTKFALHLIRLLREGLDILEGRGLVFPLPYAEDLLKIRRGEVSLEELLAQASKLMEKAENVESKLPEHCDMNWLNDFQVRMLTEFWATNK